MTKHAPFETSAKTQSPKPSKIDVTHITQEDFLEQLREVLALYDHDKDGLLDDDDWKKVAKDLNI